MALWDIAAKEKGVPLVELLGGAVHRSLPACASLHVNQPTIEDSVAAIAGYIAGGFRSAKLGLGKRGPRVRGAIPTTTSLSSQRFGRRSTCARHHVDAGNGTHWDVPTAIRVVHAMEEHAIGWIEEPFHPSDIAAHLALRTAVHTPIAAARGNGRRPAIAAGSTRAPSRSSASIRQGSRA